MRDGWDERRIQNYLLYFPHILLGRHRTGHGTYAFGEMQLGNQHRLDWAIANGNSGGMDWELIELETPLALPFKRDGDLSEAARKGVKQIRDWRTWIGSNIDYARRPKTAGGLGFYDIGPRCRGVVVVGRRSEYNQAPGRAEYDPIRRTIREESLIEIVSYETFLESLRFRFTR